MYKIAVPEMIIAKELLPKDILDKCILITGKEHSTGQNSEFMDDIDELDAIVFTSINNMSKDVLADAKKLKIAFKAGAWPNNIDFEYAKKNNIAVGWSPAANAQSVAEYTLLLMLAQSRKLEYALTSMKEYQWRNQNHLGEDVHNKNIGIIGLGAIGRILAQLLSGFNANVYGYDPFLDSEEFEKIGVIKTELDQLLEISDVISLHSPLTPETEGMINSDAFKKMKNNAIIINTARGPLINEQDLIVALKEGEINGAALDVFYDEPLSKENELRNLDNVLITPHIAARTNESAAKEIIWGIQGAFDYLEGKKPQNATIVYPD